MSMKDLVDGVRRDIQIPLPLSRSRDLISRIIYGRPYSAAMAAESQGKLGPASLDSDRIEDLAEDFGDVVWRISEAAAPRVNEQSVRLNHLTSKVIVDVTALAAQKDAWYSQSMGRRKRF